MWRNNGGMNIHNFEKPKIIEKLIQLGGFVNKKKSINIQQIKSDKEGMQINSQT